MEVDKQASVDGGVDVGGDVGMEVAMGDGAVVRADGGGRPADSVGPSGSSLPGVEAVEPPGPAGAGGAAEPAAAGGYAGRGREGGDAVRLPEPLPSRPAAVVRRSRAMPVLADLARRPAVVAGTSAVAALGVRAVAGAVARHLVRRQAAAVTPTTLVVNVVVLCAHHDNP